jgi:predicted dehydrogenase
MSTTTAPRIRLALIGLSSSSKSSWASTAHLPYLLSPAGQSKYQIVALLNSSAAAARKAIETYNLPASTRAYGDPVALAADKEVDLVVNTTRVDKHYETVLDSVKAGKDVYVEWPLAQDAKHARELAEGRIGKVLSSEVRAFGGTSDREVLPGVLEYWTDRAIGGNFYTIAFAHGESRLCG